MLYSQVFPWACVFAGTAYAQINPLIVGTWTSKARTVFTGPSIYNPVNETINEPEHPGISYSFTADGHYEEALYRAISNPTSPKCTSAIIQWQHGTYTQNATGALFLTPIAVDGRQLLSDFCDKSNYFTRYSQNETMSIARVYTDPYNNQQRLDLFQWDGTPVAPMWLAYTPPQMLPTQTLNPTTASTGANGAAATSTTTGQKLKKRTAGAQSEKLVKSKPKNILKRSLEPENASWWFYMGFGMITVGSILYACF